MKSYESVVDVLNRSRNEPSVLLSKKQVLDLYKDLDRVSDSDDWIDISNEVKKYLISIGWSSVSFTGKQALLTKYF